MTGRPNGRPVGRLKQEIGTEGIKGFPSRARMAQDRAVGEPRLKAMVEKALNRPAEVAPRGGLGSGREGGSITSVPFAAGQRYRLAVISTTPMPPSTNRAETASRALICSPRTRTPRAALTTGTDSCTEPALIAAMRTRTRYQMT